MRVSRRCSDKNDDHCKEAAGVRIVKLKEAVSSREHTYSVTESA